MYDFKRGSRSCCSFVSWAGTPILLPWVLRETTLLEVVIPLKSISFGSCRATSIQSSFYWYFIEIASQM